MSSAWQRRRESILSYIECYQKELAALDALGEMENVDYLSANGFGKTISITPTNGTSARDMALSMIARMRERGQAPPIATKHLDASTGKITYSVPGPMPGWTAEIAGGDPRCKVVPVTKTRTIPGKPAVPDRVEEYVEYVIENPEECGASTPGAPDDVPF